MRNPTIPRSRPLVLCPGLGTTQADLHELVHLLRRDHEVVTFDLRGHGLTPPARYSFDGFLDDLKSVMATIDEPPVLVGYSLGADLAVHYAAEHAVSRLVLIDGANPVPEPFVTEADLPEFRAMWREAAAQQEHKRGTPHQVLLTGQEILDLNVEIDAIRVGILDRYRRITCPITMIMSMSMAGDRASLNRNWRAGIDRLTRAHPHITTHWLDGDHGLPFTHARQIAGLV